MDGHNELRPPAESTENIAPPPAFDVSQVDFSAPPEPTPTETHSEQDGESYLEYWQGDATDQPADTPALIDLGEFDDPQVEPADAEEESEINHITAQLGSFEPDADTQEHPEKPEEPKESPEPIKKRVIHFPIEIVSPNELAKARTDELKRQSEILEEEEPEATEDPEEESVEEVVDEPEVAEVSETTEEVEAPEEAEEVAETAAAETSEVSESTEQEQQEIPESYFDLEDHLEDPEVTEVSETTEEVKAPAEIEENLDAESVSEEGSFSEGVEVVDGVIVDEAEEIENPETANGPSEIIDVEVEEIPTEAEDDIAPEFTPIPPVPPAGLNPEHRRAYEPRKSEVDEEEPETWKAPEPFQETTETPQPEIINDAINDSSEAEEPTEVPGIAENPDLVEGAEMRPPRQSVGDKVLNGLGTAGKVSSVSVGAGIASALLGSVQKYEATGATVAKINRFNGGKPTHFNVTVQRGTRKTTVRVRASDPETAKKRATRLPWYRFQAAYRTN